MAEDADAITMRSWMVDEEPLNAGDACSPSQREYRLDLHTWKASVKICAATGAEGTTECPDDGPGYELEVSASSLNVYRDEDYGCEDLAGLYRARYVNPPLQPPQTRLDGILLPGG